MYTYPKTYRNPLTKAQLDAISVFAARLAPDNEDDLWALIRAFDSFLSYHLNDFNPALNWLQSAFRNKEKVLALGRGPRTRANTLRAMYDAENKTEAPVPQAKRARTSRKAAPKAQAPVPQAKAPNQGMADAIRKAFEAHPEIFVKNYVSNPDAFTKRFEAFPELLVEVLIAAIAAE